MGAEMEALAQEEEKLNAEIKEKMMVIPNIIDPSVPIGKDDSQNVEIEKFGEPVVPDFEIPYHTDTLKLWMVLIWILPAEPQEMASIT